MTCDICKNTGFITEYTVRRFCPAHCPASRQRVKEAKAARPKTDDEILEQMLGLKPCGQSLVMPHQRDGRTVLYGE